MLRFEWQQLGEQAQTQGGVNGKAQTKVCIPEHKDVDVDIYQDIFHTFVFSIDTF